MNLSEKGLELIKAGKSHSYIVKALGVSKGRLSRLRKKNNLSLPNPTIPRKSTTQLKEATSTKEEDGIHEIRHEGGEIISKEDFLNHIKFDKENFEIISYQANLRPVVIRNGRNETILVKKFEHFLRTKPIEKFDLSLVCTDINLISSIEIPAPKKVFSQDSLILVISDEHVGMDTSKSQFGYVYNHDVIIEIADKVITSISKKQYEKIIIVFCGDGLDGRNGQTTRGGHKLPQTASNTESFNTYVEFKLRIIRGVRKFCNNLFVRNVNNSNHGGDFEAIANLTVGKIIEGNGISYESYNKFMNHIIVGNRCFIITHGKDQVDMKFGLSLNPNDKVVNFVNHYIENCGLRNCKVTLLKGDLHQSSYHKTKQFDYHNFLSFAPPSQRVQANFGDSLSGYSTLEFNDDYISRTDYELEYEKNIPSNDIF